jgi:hypothetical protein
METTYSTRFDRASVIKSEDTLVNVINKVWYTIVATTSDGYMKILKKSIDFPSPAPQDFIEIQYVTEQTLIDWIEAQPDYLTDNDKQSIQFRLQLERDKPLYSDYMFSFMPYDELRYNLVN